MATIATLLGLDPPAPERARVLELGCASATNLIAMAGGLPDADFVGVDSSQREIQEARTTIAALGRSNVTVHQMDLREVDEGFGRFDYVIAHGLYSWIQETARERLLAICGNNLDPNGVAYVSYNTYPGWSVLRSIRDMMLYRTRHMSDPLERVAEAKRFVEFLAETLPPESGAFGAFVDTYARALRERWEVVDRQAAAAVLHDELSEVNEPTYFHRFVEEATRHGLQYLAEADLLGAHPSRHTPAVVESIRSMAGDVVEAE
ncbi:MAG: methyltransferase domain-containing protein, partial [Gaiellaceae bacterium]